jgi:hypothetical protein
METEKNTHPPSRIRRIGTQINSVYGLLDWATETPAIPNIITKIMDITSNMQIISESYQGSIIFL